jgi:hypothetical protein
MAHLARHPVAFSAGSRRHIRDTDAHEDVRPRIMRHITFLLLGLYALLLLAH